MRLICFFVSNSANVCIRYFFSSKNTIISSNSKCNAVEQRIYGERQLVINNKELIKNIILYVLSIICQKLQQMLRNKWSKVIRRKQKHKQIDTESPKTRQNHACHYCCYESDIFLVSRLIKRN